MLYSTVVEKNEQGLMMIIEAAEKFEKGKYLDAVYNCNLDKEDVLGITDYVREYRAKLSREHLALAKFSLTFNKQYATNNNGCFDAAERLFNRIRSTISGSKRIYKQFCRTIRKRMPETMPLRPSVFKRSELVNNYHNGQLFGFETYEECVARLYEELEGFFRDLVSSLALCRMIINEEKIIRNTPERCMGIYRKCYDQTVLNSTFMVRTFKENKVMPKDEMAERKKCARSEEEFVCSNFHTCDTSQFQSHVVASELIKGQSNGLTDAEIRIFGSDNIDLVKKVRLVIQHFDELEEEGVKGKHKGKHYGPCVASFMLWCKIGMNDQKVKSFVAYFNDTYKGVYPPVKENTVDSHKNAIIGKRCEFDHEGFKNKIEDLIEKYRPEDEQTLKMAANF